MHGLVSCWRSLAVSPPNLPCRILTLKSAKNCPDSPWSRGGSLSLVHETPAATVRLVFGVIFNKLLRDAAEQPKPAAADRKFESFTSILLVVSQPPQYVGYVWKRVGGDARVKYRPGVTSERETFTFYWQRERRQLMFCHMLIMFGFINPLISAAAAAAAVFKLISGQEKHS